MTLIERSRSLPNLKIAIAFEPSGVVADLLLDVREGGDQKLFNPGDRLVRLRQPAVQAKRAATSRIMIMERSLSRAVLLEDMIESANYAVTAPLATAKAAIAELADNSVDLVALDVDEIADAEIESLRLELDRREIPCIAIGTSSRLAQIKAGAFSALIAKPIDRAAFLRALSLALGDNAEPDDGDV